MGVPPFHHWCSATSNASKFPFLHKNSTFVSRKFIGNHDMQNVFPAKLCSGCNVYPRVCASQKSVKKLRRNVEPLKRVSNGISSKDNYTQEAKNVNSDSSASATRNLITLPSRSSVLQACILTSGLIAVLGVVIQQVSHVASAERLPIVDCTSKLSFDFEMWHLELITGLVLLISSCRYLLLKTWPNFAESSEASNQQVLSSLQPLDYLVVAFLPGFSEELLFRGALLPLFGFDWKSVLIVSAIFGVLHLGGGRKYSFAIWATLVGVVYGYATVVTSSMVVPMASHALNNLVGGVLWRYRSESLQQQQQISKGDS